MWRFPAIVGGSSLSAGRLSLLANGYNLAESDDDAIAKIEAQLPDARSEIWHGKRLVAALSPMRRSA